VAFDAQVEKGGAFVMLAKAQLMTKSLVTSGGGRPNEAHEALRSAPLA
jgi:hypothetical protein